VLRVGVIVLAAGRSLRFGAPSESKLLALLRGEPIVHHAASAAVRADVGEVVVVTGDRAADIAAAVERLPVRVVHDDGFAEGMAAPLRRGVQTLASADAVMVALGDQPEVPLEAYRRVVERWHATGAAIVVPRYAGAPITGHPALFAASVFSELLSLRGDVGARGIVAADPGRVLEEALEWPPPRDVDSTDDLRALTSRSDA
jgi:molybdenum cofactor cytidylyltransferase